MGRRSIACHRNDRSHSTRHHGCSALRSIHNFQAQVAIKMVSNAQPDSLRIHVADLESLLREYLCEDSPRSAFQIAFAAAVGRYSQFIQARPYYPLLDIGEYGGPEDSLRKLCAMALERLPREELDRETRHWIEENLIDGDEFSFFHSNGVSKFGASLRLYRSEIDGESFLLSALNGTLKPPQFRYSNLLSSLRDASNGEIAAWISCSEPDNAFANVEAVWTLGSVYEEPQRLARLEQVRGDSVQWGNCYLLLLPKSKSWMLVNHYYFSGFEVSLHATQEFIEEILVHSSFVS